MGVDKMEQPATDTVHYTDRLGLVKAIAYLEKILPEPGVKITYLFIGSEHSTGDSFGPLTGTLLKKTGYKNIIGSLDDTVHAKNLAQKIKLIPREDFVVAVDATMGSFKDLGHLIFRNTPLKPGAAFNREELPPVGQASVLFNVAPAGLANFLMLNSAGLNKVWLASNLLYRAIVVITHRRSSATSQIRQLKS